jgi:DNA-binding transcriptional MerR regulator
VVSEPSDTVLSADRAGQVVVSELLRIGEAATRVGVSCRTIRYYEELGLIEPTGHSPGGARRYTLDDVARLRRIRELQELLGFDLGEIGAVLRGEDQLEELRSEFQAGVDRLRHRQIVLEAIAINDLVSGLVRAKRARLDTMLDELEGKAQRYRRRARELDLEASTTSEGERLAQERAPLSPERRCPRSPLDTAS